MSRRIVAGSQSVYTNKFSQIGLYHGSLWANTGTQHMLYGFFLAATSATAVVGHLRSRNAVRIRVVAAQLDRLCHFRRGHSF